MINLFSNVFLDYEKHYNTKYEHLFVSSKDCFHPLSQIIGESFGDVKNFEEYLEQEHRGDEEIFWKKLLEKKELSPFILFADSDMLIRLLLTFWKSIFQDLSKENVYELYQCYVLESSASSFLLNIDRSDNPLLEYDEPYLPPLSPEILFEKYQSVKSIDALRNLDKKYLSLEYQIVDFLAGGSIAKDKMSFLSIVKKNAWESWFFDLQDIKSQIVLALHSLDKLFPDLKGWESKYGDLRLALKEHPHLRWMTDKNFNLSNINYIIKNYRPEIFPELQKRCDQASLVEYTRNGAKVDPIDIFNGASQCYDLFNHDYEKIFFNDVASGFECSLISRLTPFRLGGYFTQRVYQYYRENKSDKLTSFLLA